MYHVGTIRAHLDANHGPKIFRRGEFDGGKSRPCAVSLKLWHRPLSKRGTTTSTLLTGIGALGCIGIDAV